MIFPFSIPQELVGKVGIIRRMKKRVGIAGSDRNITDIIAETPEFLDTHTGRVCHIG